MLDGEWEGKLQRARQGDRFDREVVGNFILQHLTEKFQSMGETLANAEDLAMELYPRCQDAFLSPGANFGIGAMVLYMNRAVENCLIDFRRTPMRVHSKRLWHAIHESNAWLRYIEMGGMKFVTLRNGSPSGILEQFDGVRSQFGDYKVAPRGWLALNERDQKLVRAVSASLIEYFGAAIERNCLLAMLVDLIPIESRKEVSWEELITEPIEPEELEELMSLPEGCWEQIIKERPTARATFLCRLDQEMVEVLAPEPAKPNWCNAVREPIPNPEPVYDKLALDDEQIGKELDMSAGGVKTMRCRFLAKIRASLEMAFSGSCNPGQALT